MCFAYLINYLFIYLFISMVFDESKNLLMLT
jgi:hypothetical protein